MTEKLIQLGKLPSDHPARRIPERKKRMQMLAEKYDFDEMTLKVRLHKRKDVLGLYVEAGNEYVCCS